MRLLETIGSFYVVIFCPPPPPPPPSLLFCQLWEKTQVTQTHVLLTSFLGHSYCVHSSGRCQAPSPEDPVGTVRNLGDEVLCIGCILIKGQVHTVLDSSCPVISHKRCTLGKVGLQYQTRGLQDQGNVDRLSTYSLCDWAVAYCIMLTSTAATSYRLH